MNNGYRVWSKDKKAYVDSTLKSSIGFYMDTEGCVFEVTDDGFDNVEWHEKDERDVIVEQNSGVKDIDGKDIHEGDIVKQLYVTPIGEVTEDFDEDILEIIKKYGCFGVETKTDFIPLSCFYNKTMGEYVPNHGNKTIYEKILLKVVGNVHVKE